eukprot:8669093-Lingulodinium_polyedra.AAC.1
MHRGAARTKAPMRRHRAGLAILSGSSSHTLRVKPSMTLLRSPTYTRLPQECSMANSSAANSPSPT